MKTSKSTILSTILGSLILVSTIFLNFKRTENIMKTKINAKVEIIEFTDPACTWCWGSEPILRKLQYRYKEQLKISFIMGGLVEDAHTFMDNRNNIGGDLNLFNKQVGEHWLEASERHGMPVQAKGFKLFDDENPSTYPMNIAYKAAQFQDEAKANKFLRRMREAIAAEAKQANKMEVLIELAQDSGLNISEFIEDMKNGKAEKAFEEDRYLTRTYQATGFPSFLIRNEDGKEIMLRGYQSYENFQSTLNHLSDGKLVESNEKPSEETILNFVKTFKKVTTAEIKENFDLSEIEVDRWIKSLIDSKTLNETPVGNGFYYQLSANGSMCDDTGTCNL